MEQTLKEHEHLIEEHDTQLDQIQRDVTDIKVRLGIKDITNGNVIKYQEELVKAQENERLERKEQDGLLREDIKKMDDKIWYILTGVILSVLLEIGFMFFKGG